jgi:phosphoglycolate phosphatase
MHLVLFDIDGTLLNSGGCGRAATRLAIQDVFGTIGRLDDISFAGKTDWEILNEALAPVGIPAADIQAQIVPYNQTVAGHLLGLVTGNMAGLVPVKLRAAGYNPDDFKVGAYGSEGWLRSMLPPLALRRARGYAGVDFPGDRIVIIGDTPGDILCAQSVQGRTIAVATGPYSVAELQSHGPTHVFENLSDQAAVLAAILSNGSAA